jgi:hypothetical protein
MHRTAEISSVNLDKIRVAFCLALLLAACASTSSAPPAVWDGLAYRSGDSTSALYARPGASLNGYRRIVLQPLVVYPVEGWLPVYRVNTSMPIAPHVPSSRERQYIEENIGPEFTRILAEELAQGGYRVVGQVDPETLLIRTALANVYMEKSSTGRARAGYPGTMTLVVDLSDGVTGQSLLRYIDTKRGRYGYLEFPNSVAMNNEFRHDVRDWARKLQAVLGEMGELPPTNGSDSPARHANSRASAARLD